MQPILKWAGGKSFIAPNIKRLLDSNCSVNSHVIEPFAGAAAISFYLNKEGSVLNDINPHLINLYKQIQSGKLHSIHDVVNTENSSENFLRNRDRFNHLIETKNHLSVESAALFYYLNRTCFNGLCRFNKSRGFFNVGWGKLKKPILLDNFKEQHEAFKRFTFTNDSYSSTQVGGEATLIIDPPYYGQYNGYSGNTFTIEDQQQTALIPKGDNCKALAFNSSEDSILSIYKKSGWDVYTFKAPRRISSDGNRDHAVEMLAVKGFCESEILKHFKDKTISKA